MSVSGSLLSSLGAALALSSLSPRKDGQRHNRSWSMPSTLERHPAISEFSADLERLQEHPSCSYYSADWVEEALEVVINACLISSELGFDIDGTSNGCKWVDVHLEDMLHLLDICNVLRGSVAEIRKQHTCVQVAIRNNALLRSGSSVASLSGSPEEAFMAVNHAKAIAILVCSALVASFSVNPLRMPCLSVSIPLSNLQTKLMQDVEMRIWKSKRWLFVELERTDVALENLNNRLNSNSQLHITIELSEINTPLQDLDRALALLDHKIGNLFKVFISARVALLNSLSSS